MASRRIILYSSQALPRPASAIPVRPNGFSLVELLTVIGVMSILTALATWSVVGARQSQGASAAILTIESFMDQCHQYAVANNTYVYVGLYQNPSPAASQEIWLGAVASMDGTDISAGGQSSISVGTSAKPISKLITVTNVALQKAVLFSSAVNWSSPSGAIDVSQAGATTVGPFGATQAQLPLAFVFAPDGTASAKGSVASCLTFGVEVASGSTGSHYVNPAVFQIAGLTGVTKVYRQ